MIWRNQRYSILYVIDIYTSCWLESDVRLMICPWTISKNRKWFIHLNKIWVYFFFVSLVKLSVKIFVSLFMTRVSFRLLEMIIIIISKSFPMKINFSKMMISFSSSEEVYWDMLVDFLDHINSMYRKDFVIRTIWIEIWINITDDELSWFSFLLNIIFRFLTRWQGWRYILLRFIQFFGHMYSWITCRFRYREKMIGITWSDLGHVFRTSFYAMTRRKRNVRIRKEDDFNYMIYETRRI